MMSKYTLLIICSLLIPYIAWAYDCNSLSITVVAGTPNGGTAEDAVFNWSFNSGGGDAQCGQFANGDYWIAPAIGQNDVTITAITTTSAGNISADVDPVMENMGLLDGSNNYGNHSSQENIILNLPQSYSGINSIVAAIQRNEGVEGNCGTKGIRGECVDAYNVVTILKSAPLNNGADMIRPNITGTKKDLLVLSDFDFSRLPSKSYFIGTNAAGLEAIRQRWSHSTEIFALYPAKGQVYSEGGRAYRSHILIDDYGAGTFDYYLADLATLFSDDNSLSEKQAALAAMITYGLDLYHARFNGGVTRYWGTGATQHPGKFPPAVFAAALLKDPSKANVLKQENGKRHSYIYYGPAELAQIHEGQNGHLTWGDLPSFTGKNYQGAYWDNLMKSQCYDGATGNCNPSIGPKTQLDPYGYVDGPPNKPGTSYMASSLGIQKDFLALLYVMPEMNEIVNSPELKLYVERVINLGLVTDNDPCVTPDTREDFGNCDPFRNQKCLYYGVTWGPINPEDPQSDCIKTPTPPYTKAGRFADIHGQTVSPKYTVRQFEDNWDAIMAEAPITSTMHHPLKLIFDGAKISYKGN